MFENLKSASLTGFRNRAGEACKEKARSMFAKGGMQGMGDVIEDEFAGDNRAQVGSRATNLVVGLVVAGLMAAFLLPIAIEEVTNTTTTDWNDGAASLWNVLPIMMVLAIFLYFVGLALQAR